MNVLKLMALSLLCHIKIEGIYGHTGNAYDHSGSINLESKNNKDWMSNYGDSVKLTHLSIPGTHNQ